MHFDNIYISFLNVVFNYPYSKLPLYGSYTALAKPRHLNGVTDSTMSYFIFLIKPFQFRSSQQ